MLPGKVVSKNPVSQLGSNLQQVLQDNIVHVLHHAETCNLQPITAYPPIDGVRFFFRHSVHIEIYTASRGFLAIARLSLVLRI